MVMYKENPKTKGSGIYTAIPQTTPCPRGCKDCFFQSGRSYLEPLEENLPNVPNPMFMKTGTTKILRMNDGNDSNHERKKVIETSWQFKDVFFNTSIPVKLDEFPGPVVLTINPGEMTDKEFFKLEEIPKNLMFVRFRTNTWNLPLARKAVAYYTSRGVPVVLTFMAYWQFAGSIPKSHVAKYIKRKRTSNEYVAITTESWRDVMHEFEDNILVSSCGKIEGEKGKTSCRYCGNCLREYFATRERMHNEST
jgi:hypothetical protein